MTQDEKRASQQHQVEDEAAVAPLNEHQIGAEFAKAFKELARGEQTASSLENKLDDIESRIEQLLASAEESARQATKLRSDSGVAERSDSKSGSS